MVLSDFNKTLHDTHEIIETFIRIILIIPYPLFKVQGLVNDEFELVRIWNIKSLISPQTQ